MKIKFLRVLRFPNIINLIVLIILSLVLGTLARGDAQLVMILAAFLYAGVFIKRTGLFTGIAIMTVAVLLTLSSLIEVEKDQGGKFFKKFQFIIGNENGEEK
jgi:hypothetical protein